MHRGSQRSRCGSCNDLTKQSERPRVPTGPVGGGASPVSTRRRRRGLPEPVRGSAVRRAAGVPLPGTCAAVRRVLLTYLHTIVSTRRVAPNLTQDTHHAARTPDSPRRSFHVRHPTPLRVVASGPSLAGRTLQVTVLQSHTPPRHMLPTEHNTKIPPAPVAARPSSERAGRSACRMMAAMHTMGIIWMPCVSATMNTHAKRVVGMDRP